MCACRTRSIDHQRVQRYTPLFIQQTIERRPAFAKVYVCFSRIKKMLGRIETRTRDRIYCQTIRTVRDISRDDRARIATCSLRTLTDRLKENYSRFRCVGIKCKVCICHGTIKCKFHIKFANCKISYFKMYFSLST